MLRSATTTVKAPAGWSRTQHPPAEGPIRARQASLDPTTADVLAINRVGFMGGVERVILTAAECVDAHGWTTALACPPGDLAAEARARRMQVREIQVCSLSRAQIGRSPAGWMRTAGQVRQGGDAILQAASASHARILHVHHPAVALQARRAAKLLDARLIWHVHETAPMPLAYRTLGMAVVRACDMILCVSHASCEMVRDLGASRHKPVRLIYNAVEPRFFEAVVPDREGLGAGPNIGAFGVLEPRKGHADLIRACATLSRRWPTLQLWIVGGPSLEHYRQCRSDLEALARDLGVGGRVHFTGRRQDVPELMARMDAVVSASVCSESLPTVLIEASALGIPIVGTDVGGTREIIRHGETGLVTRPGAPNELATKLEVALSDAGRTMAERARSEARKRFSPARFGADLNDCYQELAWRQGERQ